MAVSRLRVKEGFSATMVTAKRRETFVPGELIIVVQGAACATEAWFIRLNGLRQNQSADCRYSISLEELREKTESVGRLP